MSLHPTQKPITILRHLVRQYTNPGDTLLDMFMGSGSTGVACVNEGRDFVGVELDKKYFDIASERIASSVIDPQEYSDASENYLKVLEGIKKCK